MAGGPFVVGTWVLDRWQLRKELHVGRSGTLWLVRERDTRQLAAARIALTPAQVDRARREGVALVGSAHEGLPALVEQGPLGVDGWCVVTEHVDGASLGKVLKVVRLAPPRAVGWARQIASAVGYLHERGVTHNDLNPDNVILGRDVAGRDRLVVVGFGASRSGNDVPDSPIGSPYVVAPERVRGQPCTAAVDIYAIGVLAYRMITERWPFTGPDASAVLDAHLNREPAPFGADAPELRLPPGLEGIVLRCLEKEADHRYPRADLLADALRAIEFAPHRDWVRATGTVSPAAERVAVPEPATPVAGARGWVIAGLLVAFGVVGLWWGWFRA
jgi:eukaryotic-like serine/threonine-protein kinase